uniref:Uncharacterized protein n=1 Tax=viral metagenome TaxID=1070528 RepID=A0A6C0BML1_9ZZZZ
MLISLLQNDLVPWRIESIPPDVQSNSHYIPQSLNMSRIPPGEQ